MMFLSTSAFFLAVIFSSHLRSGSWSSLAVASALSGYAIAIRPSGLVFVPAIAAITLAAPHSSLSKAIWVRLFVAVAALLLILLLQSFFYHVRHPGPWESLLANQMFGKAGMIDVNHASELIGSAPAVTKPLQIDLEANLSPGLPARCWLLQNYETLCGVPLCLRREGRASGKLRGEDTGRSSRCPDYVAAYLITSDSSFDHWRCLWTLYVPLF